MKAYHKDAYGFPSWFRQPTGTLIPRYSFHAQQAALNDRYGKIDLPRSIKLEQFEPIELHLDDNNRPHKIVIRGPLDHRRDLVMVVHPDGFVKTVWVNLKSDQHKTLDKSPYSRP